MNENNIYIVMRFYISASDNNSNGYSNCEIFSNKKKHVNYSENGVTKNWKPDVKQVVLLRLTQIRSRCFTVYGTADWKCFSLNGKRKQSPLAYTLL